MKDLKEMITVLNDCRKEDPKEFYGGIAAMIVLFGGFYVVMWVAAICEGRV
jgi:hypothetical protein